MKHIILSPQCSGKTVFLKKYSNVICNEGLSSSNYWMKGIRMGSTGAIVPPHHTLYKDWIEIYKIGVELFYNDNKYDNHYLIYNCGSHISWLKEKYPEINIKIVIKDELTHYNYYTHKISSQEYSHKTYQQLMLDHQNVFEYNNTWDYIKHERDHYVRLAQIFNIPIFSTFEETLN